MKRITWILLLACVCLTLEAQSKKVYHSGGGEIIFSSADMIFNGDKVSTNLRFTLFFHTQQHINLDLTNNLGFYSGFAITMKP